MARGFGQVDGGAHAPRDGLAMQEARVVRLGFQRVPERVAEIQDAAQVAFAFVAGNHFGLHAHALGDDVVHRLRIPRQHVLAGSARKVNSSGSRMMPALMIS